MSYATATVKIPATVLSKMVGKPVPDSVHLDFSAECSVGFGTLNGNCGLGSISGMYRHTRNPRIPEEWLDKYGLRSLTQLNKWDNPRDTYMHAIHLYSEPMRPVHMQIDDTFCAKIVDGVTGVTRPQRSGYIISDNIARTIDREPYETFKASYFAHYLIRKRVGIVYALPASINPVHQTERDTTIIQTWYWIPENAIKYHVRGYTKRINCLRLPTKAEFKKTWANLLNGDYTRRIGL